MRLVLAGVALLAATAVVPTQASADIRIGTARWCAVTNSGRQNVTWDCHYATIEQCVPNVIAGNRGFCNLNPAFTQASAGCHTVTQRVMRDGKRVTVRRKVCD